MGRIAIGLLIEAIFLGIVVLLFPIVPPSAYLPTIALGLLLGVGFCMVAWRDFDRRPGRTQDPSERKRGILPIAFIIGPLISQLLIAFLSRAALAVFGMGLMIGLMTMIGFAIVLNIRYPPQEDT
jgi:hypothetical protein